MGKMLEQVAVWEIKNVPVSNNMISQYNNNISYDAGEVLSNKLKNINFSF